MVCSWFIDSFQSDFCCFYTVVFVHWIWFLHMMFSSLWQYISVVIFYVSLISACYQLLMVGRCIATISEGDLMSRGWMRVRGFSENFEFFYGKCYVLVHYVLWFKVYDPHFVHRCKYWGAWNFFQLWLGTFTHVLRLAMHLFVDIFFAFLVFAINAVAFKLIVKYSWCLLWYSQKYLGCKHVNCIDSSL